MTIRVFVSSDPATPFGDAWQPVGILESGDSSINVRAAQTLQSLPLRGRVNISFYLSGDPAATWVRATSEQANFGIAFDLFGDGTRVVVAQRPAAVTPLAVRPPEPHPGLTVRPVMLPIKVSGALQRI